MAAIARGMFPGAKTPLEGVSTAGPLDSNILDGIVNFVKKVGSWSGDWAACTDDISIEMNDVAYDVSEMVVGVLA